MIPGPLVWHGFCSQQFWSRDPKWMFPKIGVPQNGWFIMENPIKMDELGVPLFSETPKWSAKYCELCSVQWWFPVSPELFLVKLARDLTRPISPKWWFSKGNPLISGNSRSVNYYNLASFMVSPELFGFIKLSISNRRIFEFKIFTLDVNMWESWVI